MGRPDGWMVTVTGRPAMRSPGRPPYRRDIERQFWAKIAEGLTSDDAAVACGVSQAVGTRWFRQGGGMPPFELRSGSGRYLSFAEREEIALAHGRGESARAIAQMLAQCAHPPSRPHWPGLLHPRGRGERAVLGNFQVFQKTKAR